METGANREVAQAYTAHHALTYDKLMPDVKMQNFGTHLFNFCKDNSKFPPSERKLAWVIKKYYQSGLPILVVVTRYKRGNRIKHFLDTFLESSEEKRGRMENNLEMWQV